MVTPINQLTIQSITMRKAPKLPVCDNYEIHNGNPVAVLYREKTTDKTEPCSFCSLSHRHGFPDGHRNAHCSDNVIHRRVGICLEPFKLTPDEITASDGTVLKREHGYIIRTRPNQDAKEDLLSLAIAVVQVLDIRAKAGQTKQTWEGYQNGRGHEVGTSIERLISQAKRTLQTHNS